MYILGISCYYHDASAALIKDGHIIAAAEEERFTRKKHDQSFPVNAIQFCLQKAEITPNEISYVAFYEKPILKFERLLMQHIAMFPFSFWSFYKAMPNWIVEKLRIPTTIRKKLKFSKHKFKGEILFVEHHMAHAASSYLVSPFKESAILTIDGVGEWTTTAYGFAKENDITLSKKIDFPHSLGLLYSAVTAYLGFKVNNDEYKVMGLAPYGKPVYFEQMRKLIDVKEDGSYALDMSYFTYHYKLKSISNKFIEEFGPVRKSESQLEQRHKDIAASVQKLTEEVIFQMLNHLHKETKCNNVCLAGGVALNSVANGKITKHTPFKNIFIQPAASDAGTALGAALCVWHTILGNKREYVQTTSYFGPSFTTEEIKHFLDEKKIVYQEYDKEEIPKKTAELINKNNVIGWFQGGMEWGPRALGNRSILSNASHPDMKDILNAKVKHREMFRPFAPVILQEKVHEWFEIDKDEESFMLFVYPFKEEKKKLVPSVVHVDGSGRLQTINKEQNEAYYSVIKEYEKLTGIPILINTSFNIRGEPIVCTPQQAYRCMMGTGIDYLIIDKFIIARKDNPNDMWDSEKLAKD
jgi:carbamoyltransferase